MKDRELLKPMVKLVGNMHGNEAVAREVMILMMHCFHNECSLNLSIT